MTGCAASSPQGVVDPALAPPTPPVTGESAPPGAPAAATLPADFGALPTPTLAGGLAQPTADLALVIQPPPPATATLDPAQHGRYTLSAAPGVPEALRAAAQDVAAANPELFTWVEGGAADVRLTVADGEPLAQWLYAAAAPFATVADETTAAAISAGWTAGSSELGRLLVDADTAAAFEAAWGAPTGGEVVVAASGADDFLGRVWAARPAWLLVPFDQLRPEWKVLRVDGRSPLAHDFSADGYPLVVPMTITGDAEGVEAFRLRWAGPATNRDPAKLTRVAMSGVTALVRATAAQMERNGILWAGEEVAPVFQSADVAHVSNEVSFAADCPFPDAYGGMTFCSRDPYFELLKHLSIDVVELTGNHLNDWGREPLARSLEMYAAAGMQWFGGGRDLADATRPLVIDHNGNRIAFVGCNPVGPAGDWALADAAGSRPCGPDVAAQIAQLRAEGHVVIATLQYIEHYRYDPPADQIAAFGELAAAGAAAVSGSQGHHAQGFAFDNGAFIHYGLGNLFFDQMDMLATRQSFVDTYVIYDGRLLSVELWTGLIENWARPRLMTAEERADLLNTVFAASGW
jgi:poly-gamma-glutamate synthesis protein (capsule biosynthesis protein)